MKKIMPTKYLQNMHELVLSNLDKKNKRKYSSMPLVKKIRILEKLYEKGTFKWVIKK